MPTTRDQLRQRIIERLDALPMEALSDVDRYLVRWTAECNAERVREKESGAIPQTPHSKDWPHAPVHRLSDHGTFIVTGGTLDKAHVFKGPERLELLESMLLTAAKRHEWLLEAWSVFSNHYHFVGHAMAGAADLGEFIRSLHGETAVAVNRLDGAAGRPVWYNFWDTRLTYEKSYFARLHYVHHNPVRHGLVHVANQYRWCSSAWFERTAPPAQVRTIYRFKIDKVRVVDDFQPEM
jgi:putative transposase